MAWDLDDPTSYIFYGLAVSIGLSVFYVVDRFEGWTCSDIPDKAFNEPEISPSEFRLGRQHRPPLKREMVLFKSPGRGEVAGRVVGMPGEQVELEPGGNLLVSGDTDKAEKSLRNRFTDLDVPRVLVPRGCVFVLVDKRIKQGSALNDSRTLGPIPLDALISVFPSKPPREGR